MEFESEKVKLRPSNYKFSLYNTKNDQPNPRVVVILNEFHLTSTQSTFGRYKKKIKTVNHFKHVPSDTVLSELPIRLWVTPENSLYRFLDENKSLDGWFTLRIKKSWGPYFNVVDWKLLERLDCPEVTIEKSSNVPTESREKKLLRIADIGFDRMFECYPAFLQLIRKWTANPAIQAVDIDSEKTDKMCENHLTLIKAYRKASKNQRDLNSFQSQIHEAKCSMKVVEFLCEWPNAPLLAGLKPIKFTDPTRDIVTEVRPYTNSLKFFNPTTKSFEAFFKHIGSHYEYAVKSQDIIERLLSEPYSLCLKLHIPFKQVDNTVKFEELYSKEQLSSSPIVQQRVASRLVQELRKHPQGWTSFDAFRIGNRQMHHEMLQDLELTEEEWNYHIQKIAKMSTEDENVYEKRDNDHYFHSGLVFFENQVALKSDVNKEETIVRMIGSLENRKRTEYKVDETLLQKHIDRNFTSEGRTLDDDQRKALFIMLQNEIAILSGPGGSGKTTIIKTVLDYLAEETKGESLVIEAVAPTGKAAVNLSKSIERKCSTCHKVVFGKNTKNKKIVERDVEEMSTLNDHPIPQNQIDVLVIDEISMVDTLVAGHLLAMVESTKERNKGKQRIFLLGDVNQLPPVGPGQLAIDLDRFKNVLNIPTAKLTKIHRYGERMTTFNQKIIDHIKDPNCAQMDLSTYKVDEKTFNAKEMPIHYYEMPPFVANKSVWIEKALELYCNTRRTLDESNEKDKSLLMCTFTNDFCKLMNPLIQEAVNPILSDATKQEYEKIAKYNFFLPNFRVGDKVLHTKNWYDPLPELMNGSSGVVTGIDFENEIMKVDYDGKRVEYTKDILEENPNCVRLGYCSSVHKAQGDGYHSVIFVANVSFGVSAKTAYTASTRSRKKLMILTNQDIWDAQLANEYENRQSKMAYELNKLI